MATRACIRFDFLARAQIPEFDGFVERPGDQVAAIGRMGYAVDQFLVPFECIGNVQSIGNRWLSLAETEGNQTR